ncbi:LysE family translocator [Geomicrobium sp. JCM 19039]|uniref:LysE family translocator n=1 Tax=Geomicrobium sp. JCM 19039 TaxID=1460636 RepID=UPI00045F106B|nr:LysE family translocator [Geomicrobium sp. JCM 19039]GAK13411.1 transporter, LysE family [Geomicrobium sp. JCM 19039]
MELFLVFKMMMLGVSLAAPVGPVNIEMIKRGIHGGFFPSWLTGLGAMTADLLFLVCIYFGMTAFISQPAVEVTITLIGVVLLSYLAWSAFATGMRGNILHSMQQRHIGGSSSFFTGFGMALFNPINFVFWFGIFGSTLSGIAHFSLPEVLLYSFFIIFGVILWNLNIALTVHFSRHLINDRTLRGLMFVCSFVLVYFAVDMTLRLI